CRLPRALDLPGVDVDRDDLRGGEAGGGFPEARTGAAACVEEARDRMHGAPECSELLEGCGDHILAPDTGTLEPFAEAGIGGPMPRSRAHRVRRRRHASTPRSAR